MMLRKRIFIGGTLILLGLLLAAGGLVWYGLSRNFTITVSPVQITPDPAPLGAAVTLQARIRAPWRRHPVNAEVTVGKGCRKISEPHFTLVKMRPAYREWLVTCPMTTYQVGKIPTGTLTIAFNPPPDTAPGKSVMKITIPQFTVKALPVTPGMKPTVAGRLDNINTAARQQHYLLWTAIAAVIVVLIVLLLRRRHHKTVVVVIPPWKRALSNLQALIREMNQNHADLERCFVKLTDIVRLYLEERFALRSPNQTTYEFLEDMNRDNSPLDADQRSFLSEFMQVADLVKFAKMPPDAEQLQHAVNKAETLIRETGARETDIESSDDEV